MDTLIKIWTWLDGKKTFISSALLVLASLLDQVVVGIWGFNPDWMSKAIETLDYLGMGGWVVGAAHKGVKSASKGS